MKPTIFNERVASALRNWHRSAKKHLKENKGSVTATPMSSRPATPSHHMSPVHLLRNYRSEMDSVQASPRKSNFDSEHWETESPSPSYHHRPTGDGSSSYHHRQTEYDRDVTEVNLGQLAPIPQPARAQHEINIGLKDFSFDKRTSAWKKRNERVKISLHWNWLEIMTMRKKRDKDDAMIGVDVQIGELFWVASSCNMLLKNLNWKIEILMCSIFPLHIYIYTYFE